MYDSLHRYVAVRGGIVPTVCEPRACAESRLVRTLMAETAQMRAGGALAVSGAQDLTLTDANLTSGAMADWVLLAVLGRYITQPPRAEDDARHEYLEYDAVSGQILTRTAQCQVQQTVYEVLLIVSIVSIIGLMTTHVMARHVQTEYAPLATGPCAGTSQLCTGQGLGGGGPGGGGPGLGGPGLGGPGLVIEPLRFRLARPP